MSPNYCGRNSDPTASPPADSLDSPDDPRVASALAAYLADLEAGRRPSREELLQCNPEIAAALADCLDVVEFVHSAAGAGSSDGPHPANKDTLPPDTILGEYRLIREVGRGGMGVVYEAEQVSLGRRVALKVLSGTAALDPSKLQRFRLEAQAVALLHHPHIVPIFAVGSELGTQYYAMPYIEGPTLADVIHQQRRFVCGAAIGMAAGPDSPVAGPIASHPDSAADGASADGTGDPACGGSPSGLAAQGTSSHRGRGAFRALARLAIQATEALDHAHAMGILHRDIKPSNLLVDARGNLWVTDFGLARFENEPGLTRTGDLLGTLRYIAPELVLGHRMVYDPRSDIYSLGATLYELLTLRPVFDGRDRQVLLRQIAQDEPIPPKRLAPAIPRDLETIVLKALEKVPDRRYASAYDLGEDLRRFLEDRPIRARRPTLAERAAKLARRHRAVLGAALTVAFLALAIAVPVLWWEQRKTSRMAENLVTANERLLRNFNQAEVGFERFEQLIRLSDELTMKGMARYAQSSPSPEAQRIRSAFFQQAIEFYERLVRDPGAPKPIQALAYRRLGFSRMMGMQDPRAADDFRRSLTLYEGLLAGSPRVPELRDAIGEVRMNLGIALMSSGNLDKAEQSFREATSIDEGLASEFPEGPGHLEQLTDRRLQIAAWMETFGRRARAEQERRQLLAFYQRLWADAAGSPARAAIAAASYRRLARELADMGRPREQQEALRRALKLEPADTASLGQLAWSLALPSDAAPGESAEAVELAKKAVTADPNGHASWSALGLAEIRAGHTPQAADALGKAIALHAQGGDAADRLLMCLVCWRRGGKDAALEWYTRALVDLSSNPMFDAQLLALRAEAERLLGRTPPGPRIPLRDVH
jgi:serine/threonine protein kinase